MCVKLPQAGHHRLFTLNDSSPARKPISKANNTARASTGASLMLSDMVVHSLVSAPIRWEGVVAYSGVLVQRADTPVGTL